MRHGVLELNTETQKDEDFTIKGFGKEWTHYRDHGDYFQSEELFNRFLPGIQLPNLAQKCVLEIGCGGGRWLRLIGEKAAPKVLFGLEPSEAAYVAAERTRHIQNVFVIRGSVYGMAFRPCVDTVFSLGVINFVKDMKLACQEIARILKPGGEFSYWVYAYEGNEFYLKFFPVIQCFARKLSDRGLRWLSKGLSGVALLYARTLNRLFIALHIYLPLGRYFEMYRKLKWRDAELVIYDQLVPSITRYLKREEALGIIPDGLLVREVAAPSGNSWAVLAVKSPH